MPINTYLSGWNRIALNLDIQDQHAVTEQLFNTSADQYPDHPGTSEKVHKCTNFSITKQDGYTKKIK